MADNNFYLELLKDSNLTNISNEDKEIITIKIWTLLGKVTERYTMGDSSSVPVEIADARQWVADNHVDLTWDQELGQFYGSTVNGNGEQYIWMEDEKSMALKIGLVKDFDLAGVACWKLGFESSDIWDIVSTVK